MAKLDGTHLALGVVAAVAAAGAVASRSRGSRALSSMTAVAGLDPSQPWKAMVGAAKGGPSQEKWKTAFRNYPLDIDLHVVGNEREMGEWLRKVHRPAPGKLKIVVDAKARESDVKRIETERKQMPSHAAALMTPFTTMHRVFDMSYMQLFIGAGDLPVVVLSESLLDVVFESGSESRREKARVELYKWALKDCSDSVTARQDARVDACFERMDATWEDVQAVYAESRDVLNSYGYIDDTEDLRAAFDPYREGYYAHRGVFDQVVASLTCPTAAGRLLRLTNYAQAMADCYATWAVANRNPLVKLTVDDLRDFRVDKQIDRWLKSIGGQQNTTDVAIKRYREKLEQVAVPVLRWVAENDKSSAFAKAIAAGKKLHSQREPLIKACNDVLGMQRVLAI